MKQYDAIIIGFGKGGKTLAADLAGRNQKVAVIERSDKMMYLHKKRLGMSLSHFYSFSERKTD